MFGSDQFTASEKKVTDIVSMARSANRSATSRGEVQERSLPPYPHKKSFAERFDCKRVFRKKDAWLGRPFRKRFYQQKIQF